MTFSRRHLLMAGAAAGAGAALPVSVGAQTQTGTSGASAQAPAFHRMRVGDALVTALGDGHLMLNHQALPNASEEEVAQALRASFLPADAYAAPVNAYLVETGDRTILIDSGGSPQMAPTLGNLDDNLAAAGVSPQDVDTILLTHMHPDHVGHLVQDGAATFPNAELMVRAEEIAFWADPATREAMPEGRKAMVDGANAAVAPYADRTTRFDSDTTLLAGIDATFLPGHTPGHTGFRIHSGDTQLLIWGDIVHMAPVQMARPRVFIGFDTAPEQAVATRLAILEEVAAERTMIAGMHLPFPGFGFLERAGEGYAFVPAPWQYTL